MNASEAAIITLLAILGTSLAIARILGGLSQRLGIPAVLADLLVGFALGNLPIEYLQGLKDSHVIHGLAELGALILLFIVGLGTDIRSVSRLGFESARVALVGVIAPMLLAGAWLSFAGTGDFKRNLFISAALTATSIGITVRVLRETRTLDTDSGRVILGASVLDDVLGLLILTVVTSITVGGSVSVVAVAMIIAKVVAFSVGMFLLRKFIFPSVFGAIRDIDMPGSATGLAMSLCLIFAWIAERIGLAPILGAFAIGVALDDTHFAGYHDTREITLETLIQPITDFLAPIFFISMGMGIQVSALSTGRGLFLSLVLCLCAIVGKLACASAVLRPTVDRWLVAVGMLPRGEVGLIFAVVGLRNGIFSVTDYSAVVLVVAITTLLAPPLLHWPAGRLVRRPVF